MNHTTTNSTWITCGLLAIIPLNPTNISSEFLNAIIATSVINAITCPLIILLNILAMVAVKTKRQLRTKSNVVLACLATTDLVVGLVVQPLTIATYIFLLKSDIENYCSLAKNVMVITMNCTLASFNHLLLMSGERYFAIKHPFAYLCFGILTNLTPIKRPLWLRQTKRINTDYMTALFTEAEITLYM